MSSKERRLKEPSFSSRFDQLNEEERATESRAFHSFLIEQKLAGVRIAREECKHYFSAYCAHNRIKVGCEHMGWEEVVFILGELEACVSSKGGKSLTVKKWPKRHNRTPTAALKDYMAMRKSRRGKRSPLWKRILSVLRDMRVHRSALIQNKSGVTITSPESDHKGGKISMGKLFVGASVEVTYINVSVHPDGSAQRLINGYALTNVKEYTLSDKRCVCGGSGSVSIPPGGHYQIEAHCRPLRLGNPRVTIAFEFTDLKSGVNYHIIRFLRANVTDEDAELLKPTAPYKESDQTAKPEALNIVHGVPPPRSSRGQLKNGRMLGNYFIPSVGKYREHVETPLSCVNYKKKFQALLHAEEQQMKEDIRNYDMDGAPLFRSHGYLGLKVPGLAENRPSLFKGDALYASRPGSNADTEYEGYVHDVRNEEVLLKFVQRFHDRFTNGQKFNIRFAFNRIPLRVQHRAVEILFRNKDACQQIAFPTHSATSRKTPLHPIEKLQLFNHLVEDNPEQCRAVQHILAGTSRPAPYLIFGPPGTGKTMATVEAIKQVWKKIVGSRMLACTPSNSAADDLASRLLAHIPPREIVRLNAYGRSPESIDPFIKEKIMKISKYDSGSDNFWFPPMEDLKKYRIIVATLVTAGRLASASFPQHHFSHVFIDEAGHAVEPECVIPVAGLLDINNPCGGQLVLAGDPKQLGPVLRSQWAIKNGLQLSFMERLMETCDMYETKTFLGGRLPCFDSRMVTKLVKNYRSHPAILAIPNLLFYGSELEPMADELMRSSLCEWEHLPTKGFPIIFHGIEGKDEREERSPSFFNAAEASQVAKYIEMMRDTRGIRITLGDIGVISPYKRQVQKIRRLLYGKHMDSVKVGSVEEFQGGERRIIIISTVRSSERYLITDEKYSLGFLKNPKRFNVAITRAKALLIVIGNPYLLSDDKNWEEFLDFCCENGGYTGCHYVPHSEQDSNLLHRLEELHLDEDKVYETAERLARAENEKSKGTSVKMEQEDPEWRGGE